MIVPAKCQIGVVAASCSTIAGNLWGPPLVHLIVTSEIGCLNNVNVALIISARGSHAQTDPAADRAQASQQHPSTFSSGGWSSDGLSQQAQDRQEVQCRANSSLRNGERRRWCDRSSGGSDSNGGGRSWGAADRSTDTSHSCFPFYKLSTHNRGSQ